MASQVEICNLALNDLGANTISDITEGTKEANLCNDYWNLLLNEVLEAHKWDFAKKQVALALDASYTILNDTYDYAYQLPADYIRMSEPLDDPNQTVIYEIIDTHLLSNEEDLEIEYIARITDTTKFPSHFVICLAARLRASLAIPLSKKGTKGIDWMGLYFNVELPRAQTKDAQQGRPSAAARGLHTSDNDPWLSAR